MPTFMIRIADDDATISLTQVPSLTPGFQQLANQYVQQLKQQALQQIVAALTPNMDLAALCQAAGLKPNPGP